MPFGSRRRGSCPSRFSAACRELEEFQRDGGIVERRRVLELRVVSNCLLPNRRWIMPKVQVGKRNKGAKRTYCILHPALRAGGPALSASGAPRAAPRRCAEGRTRGRSPPGDEPRRRSRRRTPTRIRDRESLDEGRDEPEQEPVDDEDEQSQREHGDGEREQHVSGRISVLTNPRRRARSARCRSCPPARRGRCREREQRERVISQTGAA